MKSSISEVRLTLYALISAIEVDLRNIIRKEIIPSQADISFLNDVDVINKCKSMFIKDNPGLSPEQNLHTLIDYLYFQDAYKTILSNKEIVSGVIIKEIKKLQINLDQIIPVRNRVMHTRPLVSGDFSLVYSFVQDLKPKPWLEWTACSNILKKIEEDPSFVFNYQLPEIEMVNDCVTHNLPLPDFDESGFIGREEDSDVIKKLILGNNRVVSILGEGGIGKSALILKVAYDIVDMGKECPFDVIIWSSAKTTALTENGIREIRNSLFSYNEFLEYITHEVGAPISNIEKNFSEILEFMDTFNVLLIIDNLETILDEKIRLFIRDAQQKCKIAITSRIGLGELEYPRKLEGFTERESSLMIRQIAKIRNSKVLSNLSNKHLSNIAKQLHYNPLALKWFVNSVDFGNSPQEILNNKSDLLEFCLSNVYDKISDSAKKILSTILAARKPVNDAELNFLTNMDPLEMRKALNSLFRTTFIQREIVSKMDVSELMYNVTDFAREFLIQYYPVEMNFLREIRDKQQKLTSTLEEANRKSFVNKYTMQYFSIKSENEKIIARMLKEALKFSHPKTKKFDEALNKIKLAKDILPTYHETYRISALVKASKGDLLAAEEDYKTALELEPNNPRLLFFYSGFLLHQMADVQSALRNVTRALDLDPDSYILMILYARCVGYAGVYSKAIAMLKKIQLRKTELSAKERKSVSTMIIDFNRRWAEDDMNLNKDYNSAIIKLKDGFDSFAKSAASNEIDFIILKSLGYAYCLYIKCTYLSSNKEEQKNAIAFFCKNRFYFSQGEHISQIEFYLSNKLEFNIKQEFDSGCNLFQGVIIRLEASQNYGFIKSSFSENLFFHRGSLRDTSFWQKIKVGAFVRFSIGENEKGKCAEKVELIEYKP